MEEYKELGNDILLITDFLSSADFSTYAKQVIFLNSLHALIIEEKYDLFFESVNDSQLWGGSGSIWESEFGMSTQQKREFDKLLLNLLTHLDRLKQMQKRAKSVYKVLRRISKDV